MNFDGTWTMRQTWIEGRKEKGRREKKNGHAKLAVGRGKDKQSRHKR